MKWKRAFKLLTLGVVGLVALLVATGAVYEQVMRRSAARRFPPQGKMVEVNGRLMQIDCRGSGSPTVVLEAGLDGLGSLSWASVHDSLAAMTRTCARSRAGVMWSEPAPGPFDVAQSMENLRAALQAAGEAPPFLMVGHSIAGPYLMEFTHLHRADVAGLVLVDPSHPDQQKSFREATGTSMPEPPRIADIMGAIAWTGIPRLMTRPSPDADATQRAVNAYAPLSIRGVLSENSAVTSTLAAVAGLRDLGDRPLLVLTAMAPFPNAMLEVAGITREQADRFQAAWKALHDEEASWSTRGRNELVPDATHYIHHDRPGVVIAAVKEVVDAVRADTPSPPGG